MGKPWSELDKKIVDEINELTMQMLECRERMNIICLKIKEKYQQPESKQPHNICR